MFGVIKISFIIRAGKCCKLIGISFASLYDLHLYCGFCMIHRLTVGLLEIVLHFGLFWILPSGLAFASPWPVGYCVKGPST